MHEALRPAPAMNCSTCSHGGILKPNSPHDLQLSNDHVSFQALPA